MPSLSKVLYSIVHEGAEYCIVDFTNFVPQMVLATLIFRTTELSVLYISMVEIKLEGDISPTRI